MSVTSVDKHEPNIALRAYFWGLGLGFLLSTALYILVG